MSGRSLVRDYGPVPQIGDDDPGGWVALLQEPRGLNRGVALVSVRADHAVNLDLELGARICEYHQKASSMGLQPAKIARPGNPLN
jgi:hypothetical protein